MLTQSQLARTLRTHVQRELLDESGLSHRGTAIYSLADPRDLRLSRYIGQTRIPARRFRQHLNTARLWFPAERPWWVSAPKLRPLYDWVRTLYLDDHRLPTMIIHAWVHDAKAARVAERARILESLANDLPILNVEREIIGRQRLLF